MRFVDCVTIHIKAGHGGAGSAAFHREKYIAKGGPSGGNGGKGGSVVVEADPNTGTLIDYRYRKHVSAEDGKDGAAKKADGRYGHDVVMKVPVGTLVRDAVTGELVADLAEPGQTVVAAAGGRGGLGNHNFKSSINQAPTHAQPGEPGEERAVLLELKMLADVGIIGFPSVGKSTLISVVSNARPKIAAYPFTTLVPNLGIVKWHDYRSFVVADIPGLIEGASEGRGLGYQFLRHVERCKALVHVIEVTPPMEGADDGRDPIEDYKAIQRELRLFSETLADRPQVVALAKMDLPFAQEREDELRAWFEGQGHKFFSFSAVTRAGVPELIDAMGRLATETPAPEVDHFTVADADERVVSRYLGRSDDDHGVEVEYVFEDPDEADELVDDDTNAVEID